MKRILKIEWASFESDVPAFVRVDLTKEVVKNIRKASLILKDNPFMESIRIETTAVPLTKGKKLHDDFEMDVQLFSVYPDGRIYFYGQDERDSSIQIESDVFHLPPIKEKTSRYMQALDYVSERRKQITHSSIH